MCTVLPMVEVEDSAELLRAVKQGCGRTRDDDGHVELLKKCEQVDELYFGEFWMSLGSVVHSPVYHNAAYGGWDWRQDVLNLLQDVRDGGTGKTDTHGIEKLDISVSRVTYNQRDQSKEWAGV